MKVGDRSRSISSASRTATAKRPVPREGAARGKLEPSWKRPSTTRARSRATSSAGSRAASPSISAVRSPSCRAARSTSARCATSALLNGQDAALPDPEDGPPARQHRRLAARRARRDPAEQRSELIANLSEGQVLSGVVKNITDYGAFVDLGGVDGLLHVTDISWKRINHPTEVLNIGQTGQGPGDPLQPETQRISLGMKQLEADPWEGVDAKYPVSAPSSPAGSPTSPTTAPSSSWSPGRGPGPRLRDELDQEERSSRQDRFDQSGGRGHGARRRPAEAPDQLGLKQCHG